MKLQELLAGAEILSMSAGETQVSGLQYDSRNVQKGDCFFAIRGGTTDGNKYIDAAISKGAAAIVSDSLEENRRSDVAWASIAGGHGRRVMGIAAANFYHH